MEQLPKEPSAEDYEKEIELLLRDLDELGAFFEEFPDLQDEWYDAEMEGRVGKDRLMTVRVLGEFIGKVRKKCGEKGA